MTQPTIKGTGHGVPCMGFGSNGTDWIAILVDALGHIQTDILSSALPSDAATQTTLALIAGYVDGLEALLAGGLPSALDSGALKVKEQSPISGFATQTTLALIAGYVDGLEALLAGGLPSALDSGALKVKEQSPITGFATSANQSTMITALQLIDDLRNALGSVNTDDLQVDIKTTVPPVPASPVNVHTSVSVDASTWTDLASYTVPNGKTFYLFYWSVGPSAVAQLAGFNYMARLTINNTAYDRAQNAVKTTTHVALPMPIVATAGQEVVVEVYHAEAAARGISGTLVGLIV